DCVVVVSRGRLLTVTARPLLAGNLSHLADFCFIQPRPAFGQCGKALLPIITCAWLDAEVVFEIAKMNRSGLAKSHLRRDFAVDVADALAMLFEKLSELGLGYAEM